MKKYLILLLIPLLCSCSCYNKIARATGVSEIQFGRGGGVTNQQEVYSLNRKGELFKKGNLVCQVSCEDLERVFTMAQALGEPINEPDNYYWFIEVNGKQNRKFVWGGSSDVDRQLKNLYTELNQLKK